MRTNLKQILLGVVLTVDLNSLAATDTVNSYIRHKKIAADTAKTELCFADDGQCHPILIGKTTSRGKFSMTPMITSKPGYGNEVIGFREKNDFLFALHRVWTLEPQEGCMERIASLNMAGRIITNGCINV